jgi:DNA-binding IclR family transcriptional regulator
MPGLPGIPRHNATSLARALSILDLFEPWIPSLSATQIARSLCVRPGSLYPAPSTLERFGYLERRPDKRVRLALKLLERGHTILQSLDMYERARPALRDLARALSANAHVAVLHFEAPGNLPGAHRRESRRKPGDTSWN